MRTAELSREELYELVWSMPMIHAAKKLGISGVMLGRICWDRQVPKPPRGYWANLKSEKKRGRFEKPPLPGIGESKSHFLKFILEEQARRNAPRPDDFSPYDLSEPVPDPPEEFEESLKDYRRRIESMFPELLIPSGNDALHPIVQKVLAEDLVVAAARKRDRYGPSPNYQDERGKLHLQLLNTFIQLFQTLGFTVSVSGRKNFRFYVDFLGNHREFHVFVRDHDPSLVRRKRFGEKKRTTFCFAWTHENTYVTPGNKYYEFEQLSAECVKTVIVDLAVKREDEFRDGVFSQYADRVEARKTAIRQKAERDRLAGERKRQALEQLMKRRVELMNLAVDNMNRSDQIRSLITTLKDKAANARRPVEGLDRWTGWAAHHANVLDPRHMSVEGIEAWIKKFQLKD